MIEPVPHVDTSLSALRGCSNSTGRAGCSWGTSQWQCPIPLAAAGAADMLPAIRGEHPGTSAAWHSPNGCSGCSEPCPAQGSAATVYGRTSLEGQDPHIGAAPPTHCPVLGRVSRVRIGPRLWEQEDLGRRVPEGSTLVWGGTSPPQASW